MCWALWQQICEIHIVNIVTMVTALYREGDLLPSVVMSMTVPSGDDNDLYGI